MAGTYHDKLSPFPAIHEDVTPLWCAAVEGHVDSVTTLLRHGADIHARTANGSTAIRSACYRMQVDVVKVLLESGADVHSPNNSGVTCLMNGCTRFPYLLSMLLVDGGGWLVSVPEGVSQGRLCVDNCMCCHTEIAG